jgi:hypothetical protein
MSIFSRIKPWALYQVQEARLLGRGAGSGTGDAVPIELGTGLTLTGTTLSASGGGGGGTPLSPAQITADQNNYNPSSWANTVSILRISTDSFHRLTGLTATSDGHICKITNTGTFPVVMDVENTSSTAANRFADLSVILPGNTLEYYYDGTTARWRLVTPYAFNVNSPLVASYWNDGWVASNTSDMARSGSEQWVGTGTRTEAGAVTYGGRAGVVELSTTTGTTNRAFYYPINNIQLAGTTAATKDQLLEYQAVMRTPGNLSDATDNYLIQAGFFDSVTADPADGVFFFYNHGVSGGDWTLRGVNNTTQADIDTGVAVATNTWVHFRIIVYPDQTARAFINGTEIPSALTSTNVPSVGRDFSFGLGIRKTAGSGARVVVFDKTGINVIRKQV